MSIHTHLNLGIEPLGTIERYETMYADEPMTARATPKQAHDIVVKNLPNNLKLWVLLQSFKSTIK